MQWPKGIARIFYLKFLKDFLKFLIHYDLFHKINKINISCAYFKSEKSVNLTKSVFTKQAFDDDSREKKSIEASSETIAHKKTGPKPCF